MHAVVPPSTTRFAPLVLLVGSGGLLLGALFFQYVIGLPPCPLCLWQRYPHVAVVVIAALTLALAPPRARPYLLGLMGLALLATAGVGAFHFGVEQKWWQGLPSCEGVGTDSGPLTIGDLTKGLNLKPPARCDQIPWSLLGISMAGWNVIASLALACYAFGAALRRGGRA